MIYEASMKNIKLQIETGENNPILRAKSKIVKDFAMKLPKSGLGLSDFIKGMAEDLEEEKGLGFAAPQAGENVRICICKFNKESSHEVTMVLVNPRIIERSDGLGEEDRAVLDLRKTGGETGAGADDGAVVIDEEGCLSLPKFYTLVPRAKWIVVKFLNGNKFLKKSSVKASELEEMTLRLEGLNARVVQHEVDHLNGRLICD